MSEAGEPLWITYEQAIALHSRQLRRFGGAPGLRDEGMLRSALERPINKWRYEQASLPELAAAYAFVVLAPTNEVFYYLGMLLCGIGWSSLISIVFAIYSEAVDSREMGVSMGVFNSSLVLPALAVPGLLKLSDALDHHRWVFALFAICLALSFAFWCAVSERETAGVQS